MDGELKGPDQLRAALRTVEKNVANKVMRKALRAGAKVIQAQEIANAPERSGNTAGAIKVRAGKRKRNFVSMMVTLSRQFFTGKVFYAPFVNYGHKNRPGHHGAGHASGAAKKVPGTRWINRAFQRSANPALDVITETAAQGLEEEAANAANGAK